MSTYDTNIPIFLHNTQNIHICQHMTQTYTCQHIAQTYTSVDILLKHTHLSTYDTYTCTFFTPFVLFSHLYCSSVFHTFCIVFTPLLPKHFSHLSLAELGGHARHTPPYGTQFFHFCIYFHQKAPASEVHAPQWVHAPLQEILDPPLPFVLFHTSIAQTFFTPFIGRSRGGMPGTCSPMGPNSFIFAYIFTKKHPHQRSMHPPNGCTPPYGKSWIHHCLLYCFTPLLFKRFSHLSIVFTPLLRTHCLY